MKFLNKNIIIVLSGILICYLISCQQDVQPRINTAPSRIVSQQIPEVIDFNFHVKPILSDRCFKCHGPDEQAIEANLAFHKKEYALAKVGDKKDHYAIIPNDTINSTLVQRIYSTDEAEMMPPPASNLTLSNYEKAILSKWIAQGAEWKEHWSFIPIQNAPVPEITQENLPGNWPQNEIDHFILKEINTHYLTPSPRIDKEKLIRRVSFDLTGLPPSVDQVNDFVNDKSENAYEKLVDNLLASDAYAERMTQIWMDVSRYADTHGYQDDFARTMWPWRDWVIHAYQQNMPYDEFVKWQLAGDLLPDMDLEKIIATGFNRNHKITAEGGVVEEEYRTEYVADRTNTFGVAFLGLSTECARCHDHKYDPISQQNYFELFSFFNTIAERGMFDKDGEVPVPAVKISRKEIENTLTFIKNIDTLESIELMVMEEMKTPRATHILNRGLYDQPGEVVTPNMPSAVLPFDNYSKNRLGLSNWLFDDNHPLTARVAVNRLWQQLFGTGIVASVNDFGNQGSLPTHPELLDFLAYKFRTEGWDVKAMLKYIALSATYQQESKISKFALENDPNNQWLARAPRKRLDAEMIRDQALSASNLLNTTIGGPSVKPYQPAGIWEETTGGGGGETARYNQSKGPDLYRRSLYTFWKRTVPPPSMMTFDAASRDLCSVDRQETNTPLQALVLLNDPQMVEAARFLAHRAIDEVEGDERAKISYLFQSITSRIPAAAEIDVLLNLLNEEQNNFIKNDSIAEAYLAVGDYQLQNDTAPEELAAYALVANTIFNLDEAIIR